MELTPNELYYIAGVVIVIILACTFVLLIKKFDRDE